MIAWSLDPIGPGPLRRVRIFAGDTLLGNVYATQDQLDDLTARLNAATPRQVLLGAAEAVMACVGDNSWTLTYRSGIEHAVDHLYGMANPDRGEQIGEHYTERTTRMPCARCGRPVDAGQATHQDCQPLVCHHCTQCGRQLGAEEQAAGCRMCLVGCAPLADAADGDVVITVGDVTS